MQSLVRPELPTAALRSSQATHAAVDNSAPSPTGPSSTYKSGKSVQTNGATSDITYIQTAEGWLYLAAVIDLHSRQVVGWSMAPHMQSSLVADALRMAWFRRHPEPGLIFHSDRGSQYCAHEFQALLTGYGMQSSMSRKGNCWDNGKRPQIPVLK